MPKPARRGHPVSQGCGRDCHTARGVATRPGERMPEDGQRNPSTLRADWEGAFEMER